MKDIKLSQGYVTQVDDENYEYLSQWEWIVNIRPHTCYAVRMDWNPITKKNTQVRMHRVILGVTNSKTLVDHRDRNGLNNQRNNLRLCDYSQNNMNKKRKRSGSSKYKGVKWRENRNRWVSEIMVNKKRIGLGMFISEEDAGEAYNIAALKYFGEFAALNEIKREIKDAKE